MRIFLTNIFILIVVASTVNGQPWNEIMENKTYTNGLVLQGKKNVLIRNCHFTNEKGVYGLSLNDCENIRVENCTISKIGNEWMTKYSSQAIKPDSPKFQYSIYSAKGIELMNAKRIYVFNTTITEIFGQGISNNAIDWKHTGDITIDSCRIAFTYDDGIKMQVKNDQVNMNEVLPMKNVVVKRNTIHDTGLGLSSLAHARHGMYLKVRNAVVEDNTIYNCFFGEGISLRNAGIVRNNKVWNCARACISYWAQTNTSGSSDSIVIENNHCRQDFALPIPMRSIYEPEKFEHMAMGVLILMFTHSSYAKIKSFVIRNNTFQVGHDYLDSNAIVRGLGDAHHPDISIQFYNNTLIDKRIEKKYTDNIKENDNNIFQ